MKLLLSDEGYKQYKDYIKSMKDEYFNMNAAGGEEVREAIGDGWHDNFAYEEIRRKSLNLASQIDQLVELEKDIEIISDKYVDGIINIGDTCLIEYLDYDDTELVKLTGLYIPSEYDDFLEVSINSPIGSSIYHKQVGDIIKYNVDDREINIKILNIL